jgi:serine/threonine protein kinase
MTNREGDVSGQETLPAAESIRVAAATLRTGEVVLGKYEIKSAIGVGGMGQVFRARHLRLERDVAVKVLPENGSEEHAMRFEREAALMTRVRHPNVVEILDFGFVHGRMPCIVMELVEGEALSARIERLRALPWADAVRVILGVLDGLEAVHEAQIIHRDLKPSNVAIAKGAPEVVKLLDFGIARSLMPSEGDRRVTRTGNIVGSLDYMSPEALVNDPIDERTDVYSAGMMLFELLTGGFPFRDDAMAAAFRRLSTDPPLPVAPASLEAIPLPIAEIAQSAIARERKERPSGADDFARQLREQVLKLKKGTGERAVDKPHEPQKPTAEPPPVAPPKVEPQKVEPQKPIAEPAPTPRPRNATPAPAPPTPPPKRVLKGVVVEAPKPPPVAPPKPPVVHPTAPKIDTASSTGAVGPVERAQFVVVARLPQGMLGLVEERRWLAELVRNAGKAYALSADVWCAVLYALNSSAAEKHSLVLLDALESRYPHVKVVGGTIFDPRFELKSNGAFANVAELPDPLPSLLAMLASIQR